MTFRSFFGAVMAVAALSAWAPLHAGEIVAEKIETKSEAIRLVRVVGELENPWSLAFLPDGRMLVTERPGRLQLVATDGTKQEVGGVPDVVAANQGGLLDVALHPDFEQTGWVYLTYSAGDRSATATTLARGRLEEGALVDVEELFAMNRPARPGRHYGSRIVFASDGTLLMSIGDRGEEDRAQDRTDHAGSLIRLNDDGSVPGDNPFVGAGDALAEIYSFGHRNIQGMIVHPETGHIWANEHGPRGGDELNRVEAGKNYGWPVVSHGVDYRTGKQIGIGREAPGMEPPLATWTPAIAPSGLALYTGNDFASWEDNLFMGSLVRAHLLRIVVSGREVVEQEELLSGEIGRIRDVRQGPDGSLYVVSDEDPGGVYRLEPAN